MRLSMYTADEVRRQPLSADPRQLRDAAVYPFPHLAGLNAVLKAEQGEVRQRRHWSHMMARSLADCVAFGHAGVAMGQDADSLAS